jgi:DNA-binding LytR/AlgR family response regulator
MQASKSNYKIIRAVIVEDEPDAQTLLGNYCQKSGNIEVKATFFDALSAARYLEQNAIDLLFLDIQLPGISGLSMLSLLSYQPKVIFTTAYSEFALEAFNFQVIDYLLKPIGFERFLKAIVKMDNHPQRVLPERITFDHATNEAFAPAEVTHVEAFGNYLKVHGRTKTLTLHLTMKDITVRLEPYGFIRVHKSYLVNPLFVRNATDTCLLTTGVSIPIGISYKQQVRSKFA